VAAREPLYVLETDAAANRVIVGARSELHRSRVVVRGATLHRDGAAVNSVKLRYRSRPLPARVRGAAAPGRHARLELELGEPADAVAPGQTACLMAGDTIVGHATIAPG
jgi:tRNA-specific 2-thiouridylase